MTVGLLLPKVILILLHHTGYVLLLLLLLKTFNILDCWIQSMHSHSLLRFGGSTAIRTLDHLRRRRLLTSSYHVLRIQRLAILLLLRRIDIIIPLALSILWDLLDLSASSDWLLHLAMMWPQSTGPAPQFTHVFIFVVPQNWYFVRLLIHERNSINGVAGHSLSLILYLIASCGFDVIKITLNWFP